MKCSLCHQEGHIKTNKKFHPKMESIKEKKEIVKIEMETDIIEHIEKEEDIGDLTNKFEVLNMNEKNNITDLTEDKIEFLVKEKKELSILSIDSWKDSKTFKSIKDKETQFSYYKKKGCCEEILTLVNLESKPFGSESEKILQEIFKLGPRTSSQNDGTRNGKKIEIKSARYWAGKDDCKWQHLEPDHDYEFAMFALLDFDGWKVWIIKKEILMGELRDNNTVTFQGKQGWWVKKSDILKYLTPISSVEELDAYLSS